jgi:enediyne biosynthesis protein E4
MLARWTRRQSARVLALVLLISMFWAGQLPSTPAEEIARMADGYAFTPLAIALPPGLPVQSMRPVNQDYHRIPGWVSSVGASIAMGDLTGDGLANDLCLTDPRVDEAIVTPAPVDDQPRYQPFVLDPSPLPIDRTMAPMGCVPGDFNANGRMDLLVYYWGRTPIIFLARDDATTMTPDAYHPVEMVPGVSADGVYTGPQWNTNAVAVSDFDGDGYPDLFIGNFWPHGPVLDETVSGGVAMPASLSYALNGGENYIYRWTGGTSGTEPTVSYELAEGALPGEAPYGWALGAVAVDLDGDMLPELYIAHDFGPDRLLHNRSTPGNIRFEKVRGTRDPLVPRSKILGRSSFKGMGVDAGDLSGDGSYDFFVSNITTSWGIHESNFAFMNTAADHDDMRSHLEAGNAPFEDRSAPLGMAWSGWGWDVKMADLNNNGNLEVVQTTGFVKGRVNRWAQLQEMATTNDDLVANPEMWPHVRAGDDIGGDQPLAFFAKSDSGRYVNLSARLGLNVPVPTRGVALGDATGDGRLDFAVARQWDEPMFYRNDTDNAGASLGLRLTHDPDGPGAPAQSPAGEPADDGSLPQVMPGGSPVVDAQVRVTTADGRTLIGRLDGGSGHGGKRSQDVVIGLGDTSGPLDVSITWRDRTGQVRQQDLQLNPGWHSLRLGERAEEETS